MRYTGSSTIEWPGMVSVYAVLGAQAGVTTTGAHQVGIDFSGHLGLVREVDGRAGRHDAPPGAVYVTRRSPITRCVCCTNRCPTRRISSPASRSARCASGRSFGPNIIEIHSVQPATIDLDHTPAKERMEVAPFLTVRTREAVGHDFPITCGIPGHDHPGHEIRADVFRYAAPPYTWELHGRCGFYTDFAYSSST